MLSTRGSAAAKAIRGVQVTLTLPPGVTVAAQADGKMDGPALVPSGTAAGGSVVWAGHYDAATSTVKVIVIKPTGFDVGEFAVVTCSSSAGTSFSAPDITVSELKAVDQDGVAIFNKADDVGVRIR